MPSNNLITFRKGTSAEWSSANPVLALGEPGFDTTNNQIRIGDGVSNWNNLPVIGAQGVQGIQGYDGLQGIQGVQGSDANMQGVQGIQGDQGIQGYDGAQGQEGIQGIQGQEGIQGSIPVLNFRGEYSSWTTYYLNDIVAYNSLAYAAIQNGFSNYDPTNTSYWAVFITQTVQGIQGEGIQGAQGIQGYDGIQGFDGIQGIQGEQGLQGIQGSDASMQGTQGIQGDQGVQGIQGIIGPSINWLGEYGFWTTYYANDGVSYNGASYVALYNNFSNVDPTNTMYWQIIASQGVQGIQGIQGSDASMQGVQGSQGTDGIQGTQGSQGTPGYTNFRGEYNSMTTYYFGDSVSYNGSSFVVYYNSGSVYNIDPTNTSHWQLVAAQGIQGIQGESLQGIQGEQGIQGLDGIQGYDGLQGTQGIQGLTGAAGNNGSQGTQGVQGRQGIQGSQGTIGAQGASGINGTNGSQGTQGIQGNIGITGGVGSQGIQGLQGIIGNQGTNGTNGSQGTQGSQGIQGLIGSTGNIGSTGSQGIQGTQGGIGSQGASGTNGTNGSQGAQGIQGIIGSQGTSGANGTNGSQGTQGTQGSTGSQGNQGIQGVQGTQGIQGIQGTQGSQGTQGVQGVQGNQGTQGIQGVTGDKGATRYVFSTTITDSDPGNGTIRYNSSTISSVSNIFIDNLDSAGNSQTSWYDTFTTGGISTNRGTLTIIGNSAGSTVVNTFTVTGTVTVAAGYYKIPVTYVSGTLPTNNDNIVLTFSRAGIQGVQGITGPVAGSANQIVYKDSSNIVSGSANLTFDGTNLTVGNGDCTIGVLKAFKFNGNAWGYDRIIFRSDVNNKITSDANGNYNWLMAGRNWTLSDVGNVGIGTGATTPGAKLDVRGSSIFNEDGADADFRVEGDTKTHLLFVDASVDRVGIGTSTPSTDLHVIGTGTFSGALDVGTTITHRINNRICDGRLTLESGVPVSSADQTSKTIIYFTPYLGNAIGLYDGTKWQLIHFTEVSISLGTLVADTNYDIFAFNNAGTVALEIGPAWTNATTRSTAIVLQDGVYVRSGSTTRRYLGTFRTVSTTTTEDSETRRFLWNMYNRIGKRLKAIESSAAYTYATSTYRPWNNGTTFGVSRFGYVIGLDIDKDPVFFELVGQLITSTAAKSSSFSIDQTSSYAPAVGIEGILSNAVASNIRLGLSGYESTVLYQTGYHFITGIESGSAGSQFANQQIIFILRN